MEHAERRVLLLANPAFAPQPYTTTNLQAGLQILQPGDHAAPHRHTVAALRFVMQAGRNDDNDLTGADFRERID